MAQQPPSVSIVEVGLRDGLQNESLFVPTDHKLSFFKALLPSGLKRIELTSFVKAPAIPQLKDAVELFPRALELSKTKDIELSALVPNSKGLHTAVECGAKEIAFFAAASETFSQKNIRAGIDESFERLNAMRPLIKANGLKVRGYLSTVFGCPYEGDVDVETVAKLTERLFDYGAFEVSLGDTTGIAGPQQVDRLMAFLKTRFPIERLALHFHDTRSLALCNIWAAYQQGVRVFDSSAGGLGGCPYAAGASGNVATEDVVALFDKAGVRTGVDAKKVAQAVRPVLELLNKQSLSKNHHLLLT